MSEHQMNSILVHIEAGIPWCMQFRAKNVERVPIVQIATLTIHRYNLDHSTHHAVNDANIYVITENDEIKRSVFDFASTIGSKTDELLISFLSPANKNKTEIKALSDEKQKSILGIIDKCIKDENIFLAIELYTYLGPKYLNKMYNLIYSRDELSALRSEEILFLKHAVTNEDLMSMHQHKLELAFDSTRNYRERISYIHALYKISKPAAIAKALQNSDMITELVTWCYNDKNIENGMIEIAQHFVIEEEKIASFAMGLASSGSVQGAIKMFELLDLTQVSISTARSYAWLLFQDNKISNLYPFLVNFFNRNASIEVCEGSDLSFIVRNLEQVNEFPPAMQSTRRCVSQLNLAVCDWKIFTIDLFGIIIITILFFYTQNYIGPFLSMRESLLKAEEAIPARYKNTPEYKLYQNCVVFRFKGLTDEQKVTLAIGDERAMYLAHGMQNSIDAAPITGLSITKLCTNISFHRRIFLDRVREIDRYSSVVFVIGWNDLVTEIPHLLRIGAIKSVKHEIDRLTAQFGLLLRDTELSYPSARLFVHSVCFPDFFDFASRLYTYFNERLKEAVSPYAKFLEVKAHPSKLTEYLEDFKRAFEASKSNS